MGCLMAIKIGDVNIAKDSVDLNYQLIRTQLILELLVNKNTGLDIISDSEFEEIDKKTIEALIKKYPNMGITSSFESVPVKKKSWWLF